MLEFLTTEPPLSPQPLFCQDSFYAIDDLLTLSEKGGKVTFFVRWLLFLLIFNKKNHFNQQVCPQLIIKICVYYVTFYIIRQNTYCPPFHALHLYITLKFYWIPQINCKCQNYCLISSHLKAFLSFSSFFHLLILPFTWTHFNILTTLNLPPANHCALKTQIKSDGKIILENSDTEEFMFSNLNIPEWERFQVNNCIVTIVVLITALSILIVTATTAWVHC